MERRHQQPTYLVLALGVGTIVIEPSLGARKSQPLPTLLYGVEMPLLYFGALFPAYMPQLEFMQLRPAQAHEASIGQASTSGCESNGTSNTPRSHADSSPPTPLLFTVQPCEVPFHSLLVVLSLHFAVVTFLSSILHQLSHFEAFQILSLISLWMSLMLAKALSTGHLILIFHDISSSVSISISHPLTQTPQYRMNGHKQGLKRQASASLQDHDRTERRTKGRA